LSPRTFNIICILAIVAVGAMAVMMVQNGSEQQGTDLLASTDVQEFFSSNVMTLQPLSLGLSLAVVADLGLMTLGLVILFKDDAPNRDRDL
jgi:hypothetical protein